MPRSKSNKAKLVDCIWDDASFTVGSFSLENVNPLFRVRTVGVLVKADKKHICIAQDQLMPPENGHEYPDVRNVTTIPRGMILSLRYLKGGH